MREKKATHYSVWQILNVLQVACVHKKWGRAKYLDGQDFQKLMIGNFKAASLH
jgi:hypothetical protein